jgi:hypothetical protein
MRMKISFNTKMLAAILKITERWLFKAAGGKYFPPAAIKNNAVIVTRIWHTIL